MDAISGDGCFADLRRRGPSSDATIDLAVPMERAGVDDTPYRDAGQKTSTLHGGRWQWR